MDPRTIFHKVRKFFIGAAMVAVLTVSSINPPQAHAVFGVGDTVFDPSNFIKNTITSVSSAATQISTHLTAGSSAISAGELGALVTKGYVLDPLAWVISKMTLNSLVQSTVKWVNSGFGGSPAFVTNLQNTLLSTSNSNASFFLKELATNGSIKSPFQNAVAAAVGNSYNANTNGGFFTSNPYTLNQTNQNDAAFFNGNFVQSGGLNTWANAWSSTANNPFGAALLAQDALNESNAAAVNTQNEEIKNGNGFLSYKGNCNAKSLTSGNLTSLSSITNCLSANILTPGSVIANSLNKSLGSSVDQLVSANQLGDIVNIFVGQMLNHVLGLGGLSGTSQSTSGTSNTSYLDQLTSSNSTTPTGGSASDYLNQILATQLTDLQTYLTEWQKIDQATLSAQAALQTSSCSNSQDTLTNVIQPVLTQATTEISKAQSAITSIQNIQTEAGNATDANSIANASKAASDYAMLQNGSTLPSASDIQNAQVQSTDSGTNTPVSLYTQMNQIAQNPNNCSIATQTQS